MSIAEIDTTMEKLQAIRDKRIALEGKGDGRGSTPGAGGASSDGAGTGRLIQAS